ncbi:MAG: TauD/TfdA family dioxygenase [Gammaproteobacteria bacterium]|nr:TauD/TfdA family dioxygenase [Gammaproteobacteria bacterium]MYD80193.1 TauD/TfdA family dioxygenase [Gammaproteobacteria bacterium]
MGSHVLVSIKIARTDATLGAYISNVDLSRISDSLAQALREAFHEFGVLIFPDQHLSAESQEAFGQVFGRIEYLDPKKTRKSVYISNTLNEGKVMERSKYSKSLLRGNEGWHTDSSYMPLSAKASCLSAVKVPKDGGGTGWADMRAAYAALDESTRRKIQDLSALHSLYYSQSKIGHIGKTGESYGFHTRGAPLRPLVKIHPETKRKSLYIGRHAYSIPGMDEDEARKLLNELLDFACQPPRIYEHKWNVGDLAIWDNRCVLHRARPYDVTEPRVLRHVRIAGEPESESAPTQRDVRASSFEAA